VDSPGVARGLQVASLGVLFFALNKVLLALHNGLARLRPFAVFQSLRFVLMVVFLVVLMLAGRPGNELPLLFALSEGVLLVALLGYTSRHHRFWLPTPGSKWIYRHFEFGGRAIWGNLLADVNTRVDILLLGLFVSDRTVGVYSFAALIAEGFSQLGVVFRNVVNPHLARYRAERTTEELETRLRQGIRMTYVYTAPIGVLLILAYPIGIQLIRVPEYAEAWGVFAILMAGIVISMGYTAFQMILNQAGFPAQQSIFFALTFAANVVLNFLLIPIAGMNGSAIATAISFALSVVWLRWLVRRSLGVRM
jgi:O-antigen/teichoic acid export membrane protein